MPTPTNPLGVKGAGEAGTVVVRALNAIVDALLIHGIRHIDTPSQFLIACGAPSKKRSGQSDFVSCRGLPLSP